MTSPIILDIGDVSKQSGLAVSTLRFYEEKGLIQSCGRRGMRRLFEASVLLRLALISLGKNAGFSLDEMDEIFTFQDGVQIDRDRLINKAEELDLKIRQLKAVSEGLRHAADCSAPSHLECPTFQRLLDGALKKNKVKRKTKTV